MPSPPIPVLGHLRDRLPVPRQALTHIVILEGMEKVASQLPVVSWSARGIANATYVVWRILWEMGGEAVSRSPRRPPETPRGQDTALPTPVTFPVPCVPIHQGHSSTPVPRKGDSPHTHPATPLTFGSPSMSPDPAEGRERRRALLGLQPRPCAPHTLTDFHRKGSALSTGANWGLTPGWEQALGCSASVPRE